MEQKHDCGHIGHHRSLTFFSKWPTGRPHTGCLFCMESRVCFNWQVLFWHASVVQIENLAVLGQWHFSLAFVQLDSAVWHAAHFLPGRWLIVAHPADQDRVARMAQNLLGDILSSWELSWHGPAFCDQVIPSVSFSQAGEKRRRSALFPLVWTLLFVLG